MKKLLITALFFFTVTVNSFAQSYMSTKDRFFLGYEVAIPSGFLSKTSWWGSRFDYRRMIKPNFSVGLGASWNSFSEYVPQTTYQKPNGDGAVTADIVKEIYTVPITASCHYYFNAGSHVMPYIGLGLGTQFTDQAVYVNIFTLTEYNWGFVVRPEIGIIVPFIDDGGMFFSAAYNYATNSNDDFSIDHLQHVALTLGFTFGTR
jgi:outer membrane protein W